MRIYGIQFFHRHGSRRQKVLNILGMIGILHLVAHIVIRLYVLFNPFSSFVAFINIFNTYCYFTDEAQRNTDQSGFQKLLKESQIEFEAFQTLYSGNVFYSANKEPARALFSFERALIQPLVKRTLEYHGLSAASAEVTDMIAEPFNGFGNLYHLLVQKSNKLLKLSTFLPIDTPQFLPPVQLPHLFTLLTLFQTHFSNNDLENIRPHRILNSLPIHIITLHHV